MIEIGEQTGNIEDMLDKIADYYDDEVEMATEALMSALEPIIIIIMGSSRCAYNTCDNAANLQYV